MGRTLKFTSGLGHCFWGQMRLAGVNRFGTNLSQQKEANSKAQSTKMSQSSNSIHKLPVIKAQKGTCSMKQVSSEDKMFLTLPKMCVACEVLLEKVFGPCTTPDLVNKRNLIPGLIKSIDIRCHALSLSILKLTLEGVFPEISRTFAHRSTRQALLGAWFVNWKGRAMVSLNTPLGFTPLWWSCQLCP